MRNQNKFARRVPSIDLTWCVPLSRCGSNLASLQVPKVRFSV